jgi:hypothetical protein
MTESPVFWAVLGWCVGVLSLMQWQVWRAWKVKRNPHQFNPDFVPLEQRIADLDWHVSELTQTPVVTITPRVVSPSLQECPQCGRAFKRVKQHIAMAHKVQVGGDDEATT